MAKRSLKFPSVEQPAPSKVFKSQISLSPKDILEPNPRANINALISSLSPEKKESRFFEGELTDGQCIVRIVGFEKHQRQQLESYCANGIPVLLTNCQIQHNKLKNKLEVVLKSYSKVERSEVQFSVDNVKTIGSTSIKLDQLQDFNEYDRVTVRASVLNASEQQTVGSGKIKQDVTIADKTAQATVTLWEQNVDILKIGQSYQLNRLEVRHYLGQYHLSFPSTGASVEPIDDIGPVINEPSADSDETLIEGVTVLGVQQLDEVYSCIHCKKSVQPTKNSSLGICDTCQTAQKLASPKLSAKLIFEHQKNIITVKAYDDALHTIVGEEDVSWESLLCSPAFDVTFNKFHVVTKVSRK